jgi:hypothetical protein
MSLKFEHSSTSFLGKLDAQLVLGKRGRKRSDKKALQKEEAAKKKEKVINPDDLIKPEDLPEEPISEEPEKGLSELKEDSKESVLSKLEKISDPKLLLINSKVSDTQAEDDDDEQVADNRRLAYREFLSEKKEVLKPCINLTNDDDVHAWIVDAGLVKDLDEGLRYHQVAGKFTDLPNDLLAHDAPFEDIKVTLKGVDKDMLREDLSKLWVGIVGEPEEEEEQTTEVPDGEDKNDQESPKVEDDQEGTKEDDESESLETLPDGEVDDDSVNLAKIKKLKNPYLFVLSPINPDNYNEFVKNSKILPKLQKAGTVFLESNDKKKVGTTQKGISVSFVGENDVLALGVEIKKYAPVFILGPILDKDETVDDFFNQENPFSGLTLKGTKLDDKLIAELNAKWRRHTAESSGNTIPAVQINTMVPLNYLRMLSKDQRELQMYLGDRPTGAGMAGAAYILAKEAEATAYVNLMKKFKMPTLFYKHLYSESDIDPRFKKTSPEKYTPANVLILMGDFKPNDPAEITEDTLALQGLQNMKGVLEEDDGGHEEPKSEKKLQKLKEQHDKVKFTQLDLLHSFAKKVLKNSTSNPGTYVKAQYYIGTTVAQFNADMSICFLWGAITQSASLNKAKVLKQLPFVDKLITSYL